MLTKRVLIKYIWHPERVEHTWLFWLEKKLAAMNFNVRIEQLDKQTQPAPELISSLQNIFHIEDTHTYIVEHDPGCLTILNYLKYLSDRNITGNHLLVAGTFNRPISKFKEEQEQGSNARTQYLRLESPKTLVMYKDQPLKNFELKLVVLYSADNPELGMEEKKLLT